MDQSTNNPQAVPYPEAYRSLMTIGLLGSIYRRHEDAETVDAAVELTLEQPLQYRINRAIAVGMGGDAKFATETLGKHLDENPQDDGVKVAMAVSLMLAGDPQWKPLIESVLASSADQAAREAAVNVIGFLKSFK